MEWNFTKILQAAFYCYANIAGYDSWYSNPREEMLLQTPRKQRARPWLKIRRALSMRIFCNLPDRVQ